MVRLRAAERAAAAAFLRGGVRFVLAARSAGSAALAGAGLGVALRAPAFARGPPEPAAGIALAGGLRAALGAGLGSAFGSALGSAAATGSAAGATGSTATGATVAAGSDTGTNDGAASSGVLGG